MEYLLCRPKGSAAASVIVILATATAFVQEHRSNNAAAKLRAMVKTTASVRRHDPMKPSTGTAVRDHRNAVRDRSESVSAINWNACPQSPESAR